MTDTSPYYNVVDYGATGNGTTDDTTSIMTAISAATPNGGIVFLPQGKYLISSSLTIPRGVTLQGSGWNVPNTLALNGAWGSWIWLDTAYLDSATTFSPVVMSETGCAVLDLGFLVAGQVDTSTPNSDQIGSPPMITANGGGIAMRIEDVMLYNPFNGVYIDDATITIRRLYGQPIATGIEIRGVLDTIYIEDIHFWPYWIPEYYTPSNTKTIRWWQIANSIGILMYRCDNPHLANITTLGYNIGISFATDTGTDNVPHKVHVTNADFDEGITGIEISATGTTTVDTSLIQMANITMQAIQTVTDSDGNTVDIPYYSSGLKATSAANYAVIKVSNLDISNPGTSGITLDATNMVFMGDNIVISDWNQEPGETVDVGFNIEEASSTAYLGAGLHFFPGPYGGASTGGPGTFKFTQTTATPPS